jgi:hypothetical protein
MLTALGELSHYILRMQLDHRLTSEVILQVTGLEPSQVNPVINRLQALNLLSSDWQLTEEGCSIATLLKYVHERRFELVIDQFYRIRSAHSGHRSAIMLAANSELLSAPPNDENVVQLHPTQKAKINVRSDNYEQSKRILADLPNLIPYLAPEAKAALEPSPEMATSRTPGQRLAWDVSVQSEGREVHQGIAFNLDAQSHHAHDVRSQKQKLPGIDVYTQALRIDMRFCFPEGMKWLEPELPASLSRVYLANIDEIIEQDIGDAQPPEGANMVIYPDQQFGEKAMQMIESLSALQTDAHAVFSRIFSSTEIWQKHSYDYVELLRAARETIDVVTCE